MKFAVALLSLASSALATSLVHDIPADSKLGMKLLSEARQVAQNKYQATWVAGYSVKFQGCHHVSQWNANVDEDADVRISTKRLVRFRLCPTGSCSAESGSGCKSGYGDYIVDMNTFISLYYENKKDIEEYNCNYAANYVCANCDQADNRDYCEYDCYTKNGYDYCGIQNPYYEGNAQDNFDLEEYTACGQFDGGNNNNNGEKYYLGPYCADQGGKIYLGMFTDDSCTTFADSYGGKTTYATITGNTLPYSSTSMIGPDCFSCEEAQDMENQNAYDVNDPDSVKQFCSYLYTYSGKCETRLALSNQNNNACTYMEGIKVTTRNGIIISTAGNKNKVASAFIGIFSVSFILLGAYVYYLKTKLDRAKINLSD